MKAAPLTDPESVQKVYIDAKVKLEEAKASLEQLPGSAVRISAGDVSVEDDVAAAVAVAGDANGLRLGTPEIVRFGMGPDDMPELASLIARGLMGNDVPETVAADTTRFRQRFTKLHFMRL